MIDLNELESYDLKDVNGELINKEITRAKFRLLRLFDQGYNIVVYIRRSSTRIEYFRTLVGRIILIDNRIR